MYLTQWDRMKNIDCHKQGEKEKKSANTNELVM